MSRAISRPQERLKDLFRSRDNIIYLQGLFAKYVPKPLLKYSQETLIDAIYSYDISGNYDYSQVTHPTFNLWSELKNINTRFFHMRMKFLQDKAALLTRSYDKQLDDDEPYHMRMFAADSLRPPGLESLNNEGPFYKLDEDQYISPSAKAKPETGVDPDDLGWDSGNPYRTPEQALAEFWGDDSVISSATITGNANNIKKSDRRFMRYPTIPIWQRTAGALDSVDREIDETLGSSTLEMGSHVRKWNTHYTEKMRKNYRNTDTV